MSDQTKAPTDGEILDRLAASPVLDPMAPPAEIVRSLRDDGFDMDAFFARVDGSLAAHSERVRKDRLAGARRDRLGARLGARSAQRLVGLTREALLSLIRGSSLAPSFYKLDKDIDDMSDEELRMMAADLADAEDDGGEGP